MGECMSVFVCGERVSEMDRLSDASQHLLEPSDVFKHAQHAAARCEVLGQANQHPVHGQVDECGKHNRLMCDMGGTCNTKKATHKGEKPQHPSLFHGGFYTSRASMKRLVHPSHHGQRKSNWYLPRSEQAGQ